MNAYVIGEEKEPGEMDDQTFRTFAVSCTRIGGIVDLK